MHSIPRAVLIASLLFAPLAQGAETTPPGAEQPPLDQVTVEATRINVSKLAKEVSAVEEVLHPVSKAQRCVAAARRDLRGTAELACGPQVTDPTPAGVPEGQAPIQMPWEPWELP